MANGVVFQDGFYCTVIKLNLRHLENQYFSGKHVHGNCCIANTISACGQISHQSATGAWFPQNVKC